MPTTRSSINGFGRIGRCLTRLIFTHFPDKIDLVHINSWGMTAEYMAYLFKYDSAHHTYPLEVSHRDNILIINGKEIKTTAFSNSDNFSYDNIDLVFECTGAQNNQAGGDSHLQRGAKKVILTAPTKDVPMFIMGVNHEEYKNQQVLAASSCTTNCLAPVMKAINEKFPVQKALMTTVHAFTNSQRLVDMNLNNDWRGGRAASHNIIPSSTGAAAAIGKIIPQLNGKITGSALRVPTITGSIVDVSIQFENPTTLNELFEAINSQNPEITYTTKTPLVSSDIIGNTCCSIVDEDACLQLDETFLKLSIWYDNEMGYSYRVLLLADYVMNQ